MRHLTDEQLYDLAGKIQEETAFSPEEKEYMHHIAECDSCYRMMCCLLAMRDVAQNIGAYSQEVTPMALQLPVREKAAAVIRLAADAVHAVLDQIGDAADSWTFRRAPLALAGMRSAGKRPSSAVKKLTDAENGQTFVAYDPDKRLLVIQIDGRDCDCAPYASILLPDGRKREVNFVQREHLYLAEVQVLADGEYKLILQKETNQM